MKQHKLIIGEIVIIIAIIVVSVIFYFKKADKKITSTTPSTSVKTPQSSTTQTSSTTMTTTTSSAAPAANVKPIATKYAEVQQFLNSWQHDGDMEVQVLSLTSNDSASFDADKLMVAASTGKLPALYYTQKRINEGTLKATDSFVYDNVINQQAQSYQSDGAGSLQYDEFGGSYTIDDILKRTAKESDNQGANFLMYYACNNYDDTMRSVISSIIGRSWTDNSQISAKENALLMQAIYKQGGALVDYLHGTDFDGERIDKYLPVKVAHKIGDLDEYCHDVAIVYAEQPYVLAVMAANSDYENIAQVSKSIYEILK